MITIISAREEEQQKAANLIALKTLKKEGGAKALEENFQAMGMTTIINARKKEQQKAANLIALKTPSRRGMPRCRRRTPRLRS